MLKSIYLSGMRQFSGAPSELDQPGCFAKDRAGQDNQQYYSLSLTPISLDSTFVI
jgi:hypothetical protein